MVSLLWALSASAATIVVAQDGSGDSTTIEGAIDLTQPGDTLYIRAGIYNEERLYHFADGILVLGEGPEATVLQHTSEDVSAIALEFGAPTFAIEGVGFHDYSAGIYVGPNVVEATITNCLFAGNESGIYSNGFPTLTVTRSRFVGRGKADPEDGWPESPYWSGGMDFQYSGKIWIEGNTFQDLFYGVGEAVTGYGTDATDITLAHNTFVNVTLGFAGFEGVAFGDPHVALVNNIFASTFYDAGIYESYTTSSLTNLLGEDVGHAPVFDIDEGNLVADPIFVAWSDDDDWTNDDFHLLAGSPGIDQGIDGYSVLLEDFDGLPRPEDGDGDGVVVPDIGAFEYSTETDRDHDGYEGTTGTGEDCDDGDAAIHPDAEDPCEDLVDQDCDGVDPDCADDTPTDTGAPEDTGTAEDTASPSDTGTPDDTGAGEAPVRDHPGTSPPRSCGCGGRGASALLLPLGLLALRRRRAPHKEGRR